MSNVNYIACLLTENLLSPMDKEKSVETEILKLLQELKEKIFQLVEERSQGLMIKLQQYSFTNEVNILELSSNIANRYLGNKQNLLFHCY